MAMVSPGDDMPAGPLFDWLTQRRALVTELQQAIQQGFDAVATFQANAYLECVEKQDGLCQRIRALDRRMPPTAGEPRGAVLRAAAELRAMNQELKKLNDVQAALVEQGSRSVRCFQRVWAMGEPLYGPPEPGPRKPPASTNPDEPDAAASGRRAPRK